MTNAPRFNGEYKEAAKSALSGSPFRMRRADFSDMVRGMRLERQASFDRLTPRIKAVLINGLHAEALEG